METFNDTPIEPNTNHRFDEVRQHFENFTETMDSKRIDPLSFRGHPRFTDEEIMRDVTETERLKGIFKDKERFMTSEQLTAANNGKIVESIFTESIVSGDMFGPNAEIIIPSEYDDFVNKIDLIVAAGVEDPREREDGIDKNLFGLAFDFSSNADEACKKLTDTIFRSKHSIAAGFTPSIKYGEFPNSGKIRHMNVAKVVVGAEGKTVADFADTLVNGMKNDPSKHIDKIALESLHAHPIHPIVLDEIKSQLVALRNISYAFKNDRAGKVYHRAHVMFEQLMKSQGFDFEKAEKNRRGDKIASALYGMIGFVSDPNKKPTMEDLLRRLQAGK